RCPRQNQLVKQRSDADRRQREEKNRPCHKLQQGGDESQSVKGTSKLLPCKAGNFGCHDATPEPACSEETRESNRGEDEMKIAWKHISNLQAGEKPFDLFPFAGEEHQIDVGQKNEGNCKKED